MQNESSYNNRSYDRDGRGKRDNYRADNRANYKADSRIGSRSDNRSENRSNNRSDNRAGFERRERKGSQERYGRGSRDERDGRDESFPRRDREERPARRDRDDRNGGFERRGYGGRDRKDFRGDSGDRRDFRERKDFRERRDSGDSRGGRHEERRYDRRDGEYRERRDSGSRSFQRDRGFEERGGRYGDSRRERRPSSESKDSGGYAGGYSGAHRGRREERDRLEGRDSKRPVSKFLPADRGSRRNGTRGYNGHYKNGETPEQAVRNVLYWCPECNVPLIGNTCKCGSEVKSIDLLEPYELRPALKHDIELISRLVKEKFGDVKLSKVLLINKAGGDDRTDLIIMNGVRLGWLIFDPAERKFTFDLSAEILPYILKDVTKGIIDIEESTVYTKADGRIGGKKTALKPGFENAYPQGTYIVKYKSKYGTGTVRDGYLKVRELSEIEEAAPLPDPDYDEVIECSRFVLKNLERNAVRAIKQHMNDRPKVNVSFSGGKDSTAVYALAKKAGVTDAFFIDTGLEFPETIEFVKKSGVQIIEKGGDFFKGVERAGPPAKDGRWCCKMLKLFPLKTYLASQGECVTIQGNRWYESRIRAGLDETDLNPANPAQLKVSPIRSWRAFEVYLYIWWQNIPLNPLYDKGLERIGCYLCPAMLESEYETMRELHPDYTERWDDFLRKWAAENGYPEEYISWGLWRWKALPPKMRRLCEEKGIKVNPDFTLAKGKPYEYVSKFTAEDAPHENATESSAPAEVSESASPDAAAGADDDAAFTEKIRKDFPILGDIVYFDSGALSFSPKQVIDAVIDFEENYRSNVGRGVHRLTQIASQKYWHAHQKVSDFINGGDGVTVFTKNTTESINFAARGLDWKEGDRVLTTVLEHHSNCLPFLALSKYGVSTDFVGLNSDFSIDLDEFASKITPQTKLAAVTMASNVTGTILPIAEIARICHEKGVLLLVDGAQGVPHMPVDVKALGCDFLAFSGHKMLAPSGTGVLWFRNECADLIRPSVYGGGMVDKVDESFENGFSVQKGYHGFEAGTPNISGGIGLGAAVDYLMSIGMDKIRAHEMKLTDRLIDGLSKIKGVTLYSPSNKECRMGVVSFSIEGLHPNETAQYLDENYDIMVRSGVHCAQPLMKALNTPEGSVRASIGLFNTASEIDRLILAVKELAEENQ